MHAAEIGHKEISILIDDNGHMVKKPRTRCGTANTYTILPIGANNEMRELSSAAARRVRFTRAEHYGEKVVTSWW
jgi:hypothetical protein